MAQSLDHVPAREQASATSALIFEERIVTAEEIALFEDFDEISRRLSARDDAPDAGGSCSGAALDGWGYDVAERLNAGELSVEALCARYRVDARRPDALRFASIGAYGLRLERDALGRPWRQRVEPVVEPPDASRRSDAASSSGTKARASSDRPRVP